MHYFYQISAANNMLLVNSGVISWTSATNASPSVHFAIIPDILLLHQKYSRPEKFSKNDISDENKR